MQQREKEQYQIIACWWEHKNIKVSGSEN